jgi:hypothetical protein
MITNEGKTLTIELEKYYEKFDSDSVTKQAFSKGRKKLNPQIFKYLNNYFLSKIYSNDNIKYFKGYLIFAGDGSEVELPYIKYLS